MKNLEIKTVDSPASGLLIVYDEKYMPKEGWEKTDLKVIDTNGTTSVVDIVPENSIQKQATVFIRSGSTQEQIDKLIKVQSK